ncbi:XisH family protein [Anabaena sp. FACHB-1250]|uniref:FdxN element excision controlling factor XisH-like protein n=2 Tax=Dolichospermum TaxID=748770 RepID=A0A480AMV2_9CYAN|nr:MULTISPECIES: element excision factor XisH family protein [Nostocales]MBD2142027.1 XisH family protein [Anabaena sp. FACHB-1250]MBD2269511.1 XisH family protein [Anabaena sp. FACHB-1391]MBE9219322.1 XisH family protein [Dolichospermum flos-aquae LEGE 04289]GCL43424.1 fdxN element excision controlling factor XisH-like protein [Dolichospermum planctonicum]
MPAKDIYHDGFKNALLKDGWQIIRDPYTIRYEGLKLFADLAGKKLFSAQKEDTNIVVEIKSFLSLSLIHEFQCALGQYILYRTLLRQLHPDYRVYLAIEQEAYETFFQTKGIQLVIEEYKILLIVINIVQEEIVQWIN